MMKWLLRFAAVLTVATFKATAEETVQPSKNIERKKWPEYYGIAQQLDHFNKSDTRTIEMLYGLHTEFYEPGGPIFVYINDNIPYGNKSFSKYTMFQELVKEHHGVTLLYHYRSVSYSMENVQYLTVEQDLADLSHLIRTIKETYDGLENAKVILGGAFISGSLATWFKELYPDLVNGVWASGAPLLAKADFSEYYELLGQSIKELGGDACYNRIQNGFAELESMLANNRGDKVKETFNLLRSFDENNHLDVSVFFSKIFEAFDSTIQRGYLTIPELCDDVMKQQSDVSALAEIFKRTWYNKMPFMDCTYRSYLYTKTGHELPRLYQQCNQFGWFLTSSSSNQPFGSKCPLSFFTTACEDLFGGNYTRNDIENNVRKFNDNYGVSDLKLENVYLTYGELDPWRTVGIRNETMATIIPSCGNGWDFWLAGSEAAPELDASHKKLAALVTEWLK